MDRPNTVAGLVAKRDELHKLRKELENEVQKVTVDLDHLDAAIAPFDLEQTPRAVTRYVTKHRAQKGHVRRFVLEYLRDAREPVTSEQITTAWLEARSLRTDTQTYIVIRKRIGACLTKLRQEGVTESTGLVGEYKGWRLIGT